MKAELEQQRQHAESAEQVIREGDLLVIDGSHGEGGGQILRTALTLSALTGKAMSIDNIRARRARPGLAAQHLTAVRSVARVCRARVSGDELDSQSLTFVPQDRPIAGTYTFDIASARKGAGSALLILQTVLLPLARAPGPSAVTIDGGTHLPLVWDELYPFADRRALHAASDLGLGNDAPTLARLVDPPEFARLVAALVRCELGKHAAEILAEADVTRTEACTTACSPVRHAAPRIDACRSTIPSGPDRKDSSLLRCASAGSMRIASVGPHEQPMARCRAVYLPTCGGL